MLCFRYSHSAHVIGDKLVVVGGVWLHSDGVPGVVVISLTTRSSVEFSLDTVSLLAFTRPNGHRFYCNHLNEIQCHCIDAAAPGCNISIDHLAHDKSIQQDSESQISACCAVSRPRCLGL